MKLVNFHEIQQEDHATESDLDIIIFNCLASSVLKWRKFTIVMQMKKTAQVRFVRVLSIVKFSNQGNKTIAVIDEAISEQEI
jgi:hypothetical protein